MTSQYMTSAGAFPRTPRRRVPGKPAAAVRNPKPIKIKPRAFDAVAYAAALEILG